MCIIIEPSQICNVQSWDKYAFICVIRRFVEEVYTLKYRFKLVYAAQRNTIAYKLQDTKLDFNDLTFVHEGKLSYVIDSNAFTVEAGQAMYCPYGSERYRVRGTENAVYTSLNFRLSPENKLSLPYHIYDAESPEIRYYLDRIIALYDRSSEYEKAKCDAFTALIVYSLLETVTGSMDNKYVADIKEYIATRWNQKLSLSEIANHVHLSPSYSSALFKDSTGVSIMDYIIRLRIDKAGEMLKYSDRLISEIAEISGFCDIFYFSRTFKKHKGMSPAQYRQHERHFEE